jgi:hypothetical protein
MDFISRYLKGEHQSVYNDIYSLGSTAFDSKYFPEIQSVLKETFTRISTNLHIIYNELKLINYQFTNPAIYDWQKPILNPHPDIEYYLSEIKNKLGPFSDIPLSLKYFYKFVGACNFSWDYETNNEIPWEGADPLVICPVTDLLEMISEDDPEANYLEEGIILSGDFLTKDNISGSTYSIEAISTPLIDSLLLHEDWNITFIEYLRKSLYNCGFSLADKCEYISLNEFCQKVRPLLKPI